MITEEQIQRVMRETGMDYLQALRHLQQRMYLQRR
jgi:hypothetical protein